MALRAKVIVEIGVGKDGRSTEVLLNSCKDSIGHLWSIDKDAGAKNAVERIQNSKLNKYWTFMLADLFDFAKKFDKKIDLFYMDTDNPQYYEPQFQFRALKVFAPLMAEDGIMVIHNTKVFPYTKEGCTKFVQVHTDWQCSFLSLWSDYGLAVLIKW